jgi:GNAT superfamily N-acetyltransferase
MTTATESHGTLTIRALTREDLPAVVAIDAAIEGRPRRQYVERRLAAALREPRLHAQFAACDAHGLVGYILARVLEGEFGHTEPALRLEMLGLRQDARGHGDGARLFQVLMDWARRHVIRDIHTTATWRDAPMLGWLDAMGFRLAPTYVMDAVLEHRARSNDDPVTLARGEGPAGEVNFGTTQANDDERLALQRPDVQPMRPGDLREIARIDRGITGRDRSAYIAARLVEAMDESAVRVSLAARRHGAIVGFVMARADLGDYGRAEPVAVVDTIGVDVGHSRRQIGRVLLEELFANLAALQIERVETQVASTQLALLGFFQSNGFAPSQRLAFTRQLDA